MSTTTTQHDVRDGEHLDPESRETQVEARSDAPCIDPEFKITVRKIAVKVQARGVLAE